MDCPEFRTLFSDFVDGALGAADAVRCRGHVAACGACRRLEAAYRAGVAALHELDPPCAARDLSVRILHRARREPRLAVLAGGYGLAGALLLATFAGILAVDLGDGQRAASVGTRVADTVGAREADQTGGLDLITVEVRDVPSYGFPVTPYTAAPAVEVDPTSRYRFEVPAVWSGR